MQPPSSSLSFIGGISQKKIFPAHGLLQSVLSNLDDVDIFLKQFHFYGLGRCLQFLLLPFRRYCQFFFACESRVGWYFNVFSTSRDWSWQEYYSQVSIFLCYCELEVFGTIWFYYSGHSGGLNLFLLPSQCVFSTFKHFHHLLSVVQDLELASLLIKWSSLVIFQTFDFVDQGFVERLRFLFGQFAVYDFIIVGLFVHCLRGHNLMTFWSIVTQNTLIPVAHPRNYVIR